VKLAYRRPSGSWISRSVASDKEGVFTDEIATDEEGV